MSFEQNYIRQIKPNAYWTVTDRTKYYQVSKTAQKSASANTKLLCNIQPYTLF
jgi:hypothetical protein